MSRCYPAKPTSDAKTTEVALDAMDAAKLRALQREFNRCES